MKFDRNTVLGFVILALLFFGYFWYNNQEITAARKIDAQKKEAQQRINDSLARVDKPKQDSLNRIQDSLTKVTTAGSFGVPADTSEMVYTLENNLVIAHFSNRGGQLHQVELKKFKGPDSSLVKMGGSNFDDISYTINTGPNRTAQTSDLIFNKVDTSVLADGSKKIVLSLSDSAGQGIQHEYILHPDNYMIDMNIRVANALITGGVMNLSWKYVAAQQEGKIDYEKQNTQIGYVEDGSFDYHTIAKRSSKDFSESLKWVGIRQRFFMGALVAKDNFNASSKIEWTDDSTKNIVQSVASLKLNVPANTNTSIPLSIYYGPSDYHILKKYDLKFEQLVNLGQGVYAFVRPLNKYVILPIFVFFKTIAGSLGLAIVLLTLVIRLLISPLNYSSYLSGAKMRVLRPELDELKKKFGSDQQGFASTLLNRPKDILFVLNQMAEAGQSGSNNFLSGLVDANNTALIGYSMGGYGVINVAGAGYSDKLAGFFSSISDGSKAIAVRTTNNTDYKASIDPRIKAVVAFAPWGMQRGVWDIEGLKGVRVPVFFVAGSLDDISGYEDGTKAMYKGIVNADRYLLTYQNARHNTAPNPPPAATLQNGQLAKDYEHYSEPSWNERRINNINQHFVTAFLGIQLQRKDFGKYLDLPENSNAKTWTGFKLRSSTGMELLHAVPGK